MYLNRIIIHGLANVKPTISYLSYILLDACKSCLIEKQRIIQFIKSVLDNAFCKITNFEMTP